MITIEQLAALKDTAIAAEDSGRNWGTSNQIETENAFFAAFLEYMGTDELDTIDTNGYVLKATFPEMMDWAWSKVEEFEAHTEAVRGAEVIRRHLQEHGALVHGNCRIALVNEAFEMYGPTGMHSIGTDSSNERLAAHWAGFISNNVGK